VQVEVIGGRVADNIDGNLLAQFGLDPAEYDATREAPAQSILLRRPSSESRTTVSGKPPRRAPAAAADAGLLPTLGNFTTRAQVEPEKDTAQLLAEVRRPLNDRLESEAIIGTGGMGVVSIAVDRALRRRVAKKVLRADLSDAKRALFLFVREARITGQLDHPHIVPVHDVGEDPAGNLFFTMKHVQGIPLSKLLEKLPAGELLRTDHTEPLSILLKVCDALSFAHSRGVLHCDIKPANIMVGDFGEVYLMDWGIARVMGPSVPDVETLDGVAETSVGLSSGLAMGTPSYMSPEQARGERQELDERADVFALGAVLYRALAGRPPYTGESHPEILEEARACRVRPPAQVRGHAVPLELQRIALRAMSPNRADRYRTVRHFQEELQRYLYVARDLPSASYAKGDHILYEGDIAHAVYIVERGRCRVRRSAGGKQVEIGSLGPGDIFGEIAMLADMPRTASVIADEDTTVCVVTREVLETELGDIKPWLARIIRALADRFRDERRQRLLMETEATSDHEHSPDQR
jgi:serine/threonine-protein kinase